MIVTKELHSGWRFENTYNETRGMTVNSVGSGISFVDGKVGRAVSFTAANLGLSVGDASSFNFLHQTGIFTTGFWLKLNDNAELKLQIIASNCNTSAVNTGFFISYDNRRLVTAGNLPRTTNAINFQIFKSVSGVFVRRISVTNAITNNDWNFITIKSDGVTNEVRINNIIQTLEDDVIETTGTGNAQTTTKIGNRATDNDFQLSGQLSNIYFHNAALTNSDCNRIYYGMHPING